VLYHRPGFFAGEQMHIQDQLRRVVQYRIDHHTTSVTLLARITLLSPAHISNFVHSHKDLSPDAFERVLRAVGFVATVYPAAVDEPAAPSKPPAVDASPGAPTAHPACAAARCKAQPAKSHKKP
jgi:hypothetical protein